MTANGKPQIDIAIPSFGYKNHVAIDHRFGFIRKALVIHGARATLNVGYIEANLAVTLSRPDIADKLRDAISRELRNN